MSTGRRLQRGDKQKIDTMCIFGSIWYGKRAERERGKGDDADRDKRSHAGPRRGKGAET